MGSTGRDRRTARVVFAAAALLLVASACSGGEDSTATSPSESVTPSSVAETATTSPPTATTPPTSTPPPTTAPPTTLPIPPTPNPLDVTVTVDEGQAGTGFIPVGGGSVTARAQDGTRFTLEIPPSALLSPQEVTMTPATSIDGLPFSGGLTGAVSLAPEGLRLLAPATLTIEAPVSDTAGAVGFGYLEDGREFHLVPAAFGPGVVVVQLGHFSGYGVGEATDEDVAAQLERVPTSSALQGTQAIAGIILQGGTPPAPGQALPAAAQSAVEDSLRDWYLQFVKPKLENAQADAVLLDDAVVEWDSWWTQVTIHLLVAEFVDEDLEARSLLTTGLKNGIDELARCRQLDEPENVVSILRWWRLSQQLGLQIGYTQQQIDDIVRDCAEFTLAFTSRLAVTTGPIAASFEVEATVGLVPDPTATFWQGSGNLVYTNVKFDFPPIPPNCLITREEGIGSTFDVPLASLNLNVWTGPPDLRVAIDPGRPKEILAAQCTDPDSGQVFTDQFEFDGWVGNFAALHTAEFSTDPTVGAGILITGFTSSGHMSFRKEYDRQVPVSSVPVGEFTVIEVSPG